MDPTFLAIYDNFEAEITALKNRNQSSQLYRYMASKGIANPLYSEFADGRGGITRVVSNSLTPNNGFAVIQYADRSIYIGDVINGVRHGVGTRTYAHNIPLVYVGQYIGGKKNGSGRLVDARSGTVVYDGEWKMDKKDGEGVLFYDQGTYRGHFKADNFHGRGKLSWQNGDVYEGDFETNSRTGRGIIKFANGDVYEGDFYDGFFHGNGTYRWRNGEIFIGTFDRGEFRGNGTIKYSIDVKGVGQFNGKAPAQVKYELTQPSRVMPFSQINQFSSQAY